MCARVFVHTFQSAGPVRCCVRALVCHLLSAAFTCLCCCVLADDRAICARSSFAKQRLERLQQPASSSACRLPGAFSALRTGRKLPVLEQLPALFSPCWAPLILLDDWIEMTGEENRFDETFNHRPGCNKFLVLRAVNVNCTCDNFRPKQGLVFILKIVISFYQHLALSAQRSQMHPSKELRRRSRWGDEAAEETEPLRRARRSLATNSWREAAQPHAAAGLMLGHISSSGCSSVFGFFSYLFVTCKQCCFNAPFEMCLSLLRCARELHTTLNTTKHKRSKRWAVLLPRTGQEKFNQSFENEHKLSLFSLRSCCVVNTLTEGQSEPVITTRNVTSC